jgi:hypothetical protein
MALTYVERDDSVVAKWEKSTVTFRHSIRKGVPGIYGTSSTGTRFPSRLFHEALTEARRRLALMKKSKPIASKGAYAHALSNQAGTTQE